MQKRHVRKEIPMRNILLTLILLFSTFVGSVTAQLAPNREDDIELYRGLPYGMSLLVSLFEHDFTNPDQYRGLVKTAAAELAKGLVAAAAKVPYVGPALALIAEGVWSEIGKDVVDEIYKIFTRGITILTRSRSLS